MAKVLMLGAGFVTREFCSTILHDMLEDTDLLYRSYLGLAE